MCDEQKISPKKLYSLLNNKRREIEKETPIYLSQKDFSEGTYIIDKPGYYVLKENIIFNPKPVLPNGNPKYSSLGYTLGFFTCIAIYGKDIYLNLNEFSISASPEFALQQRFFSIIELADAPFIPQEGPANFSSKITAAENVIVRNGTLGLSSHHGIHGNMANNILLENLKIKEFEFVGIALNGGHCIILKDIDIGPNRMDIPVLATYSGARFAKMFADHLLHKNVLSDEDREKLLQNLNVLENEMDETFNEVMSGKRITSDLFRNDTKLPDGNMYGVLIKDEGFAVSDYVNAEQIKNEKKKKTGNIFLYNVNVHDIKGRVDEVIALSTKGGSGATIDVAGAVLQIDKIVSDGKYKGTNLSNLQINLAKISIDYKIPLGKNNISNEIISWANNGEDISILLRKGYKYKCGGDSMHHFNKGIIGYRFDALNNLSLKKSKLNGLTNTGCSGNYKIAGNYEKSHDASKRKGYFGADSTGINISYCSNAFIYKSYFKNIISKDGNGIGVNIIFNSDVELKKCDIEKIRSGTLENKKWVSVNYDGGTVNCRDLKMPNKNPKSIGIRIEKGCLVEIEKDDISNLKSSDNPLNILRE